MFKFTKKITGSIENYLKREEKKTKETLNELKKEDPFSDPSHASENAASDTDAFEQSSHQRIESLQKELKQRLSAIGRALFRIKKGKYGFCEECGKAIAPQRLEIIPTATLCMDCEKGKRS